MAPIIAIKRLSTSFIIPALLIHISGVLGFPEILPAASLSIETSSVTGRPFIGIVADGSSTLRLDLAFPETKGPIRVEAPKLGALQCLSGEYAPRTNTLRPRPDGSASFLYYPPNELSDTDLSFSNKTASPTCIASVSIGFFSTLRGKRANTAETSLIAEFQVSRPPILLVHGFTGSRKTLASYSTWLNREKFDTHLDDYLNTGANDRSKSSIEAQAFRLSANIAAVIATWEQRGFKMSRVDVIGHSMGGLIARHYVEKIIRRGTPCNVRKLLMIATPNHGIAWLDKFVGQMIAEFKARVHQKAAEQLYGGNTFFQSLNRGETTGRHLNPDVQYAVLIGLRHRYAHYDWSGALTGDLKKPGPDDGVVSGASAQLNGVMSYAFDSSIHANIDSLKTMFPDDLPLTNASNVATLLKNLLLHDIPRLPLQGSSITIRAGQGEVFTRGAENDLWLPVASFPVSLGSSWISVKTANGQAMLGFNLNERLWATIALPPGTEIRIDYASPELVRAFVKRGNARFVTYQRRAGRFEVVLGREQQDWTQFNPRARIHDLDTDFIVTTQEDGTGEIRSLDGRVVIEAIAPDGRKQIRLLSSDSAIAIDQQGKPSLSNAPPADVWNTPFFRKAFGELGFKIGDADGAESSKSASDAQQQIYSAHELRLDIRELIGTSGTSSAGSVRLSSGSNPAEPALYLSFAVDAIRAVKLPIAEAQLELQCVGSSEGKGCVIAREVSSPWNPSEGDQTLEIGPTAATFEARPESKYIKLLLTALVRDWVSGKKSNNGLVLSIHPTSGNRCQRILGAAGHPLDAARPTLRVRFGRR
ncbi:MAG: alpha/beta fold hydrolase [Candidatus Ozemobacteraceae bacterium]